MSHYKRPASRLRRPFLLGLTGSIGMGKSTAAKMFIAEGIPVFDADAEVHRLQGPGGALVAAIEARFPGTTGSNGVDRQKLGAQVLGNMHELAALEAIVHPAVGRAQKRFLARHRARDVVVLDVPLLFEKGGWRRVGAIAVVSAPAWMQRKRVMRRPGMTAAKLKAIRRLQVPDRVKRARADFIIETGRPKSATHRQIRAIASCFHAR
ncbi:MAG: dephospho-CoA kinase [Sphingopyxis sp.]|uniref:dephospho-CoA kinase n=1 Tax=Sphingopyxis sp. Root1497 TaxID=1736474 RepID=UPI00070084A6|nr:dephospho-CoA kinase [Sphingopyxis sp. Root1497]KQZ65694.1 dephospho-CoA kinase [Sphingopyxis sp. Root1497]OHD04711.1 MAG: dephospho-CoA kinase [Sphingopyxis sp. RIFCSPHIGHO2_01_FULL_65_24]